MKKIVVLVLAIITLSIILSSCKSSESCPAYGEAKKFQIENRR
ncbi:MAG: hypothetical protein R2750_05310 [Bacteroidales bacterium]